MDIHHILTEGSSCEVLLRDLDRAYAGEALEGEAVSAGEVALQEQEARKTEAFTHAEAWYDALLTGVEAGSAPIHDKEEGEAGNAWFTVPLDLDAGEVSAFTHALGIRTSTFFTGVYGYLLSRFSGANEALYASIHSGRAPGLERSVGMFVQTFPVLERFDDGESIAAHLKALDS